MRFQILTAALLAALPFSAAAERVSVGGALDAPVGRLISFSVGVSGTGSARVNIQTSGFTAVQTANDPILVTSGPFSASGAAIAAPGSRSFVNVQRDLSPSPIAPVTITGVSGFNLVNAPGPVSVQIGNPFEVSGSGFGGFANFSAGDSFGFSNSGFFSR